MHLKINLKVLVVSVLLLFSFSANSQDFVCKSANLLGPKLITDICWRCIFPMKLAGATMNPFNATKEDPGEISSGSSDGWANGENSNWMEGIGLGRERRFDPLWQRRRGPRRSFKSIRLYVSGSTGSPKAGLSHSFLGTLSPN